MAAITHAENHDETLDGPKIGLQINFGCEKTVNKRRDKTSEEFRLSPYKFTEVFERVK